MHNKVKLAVIATVVVIGMVFYKQRFDEKDREEEARESNRRKSGRLN
jgi:hypothetical protein